MAKAFTGLDDPRVIAAREAFEDTGSYSDAARLVGTSRTSIKRALEFYEKNKQSEYPFHAEALPDELPTAEELLERRKAEFERTAKAEEARRLIDVPVRLHGPVGIVHLGDPHVDDPGTDISAIQDITRLVNDQPDGALFAASVGDMQNGWVGRLSHLWGQQSTSAAEAWVLVEWLVTSMRWLYLVGGNHDSWAGVGDPLKWMMRTRGIYEMHGARLSLNFPNKRRIRINARHDFSSGHSQWNTAHSLTKSIMMGWRDHALVCGHRHISGYQMVKDPASGLISHAIRIASFKKHDRYAKEKGLPDQAISPAVVTVIDPQYPDDDPRLITVLHSVEEGADFLAWKRRKK
jgi:hypothetical protein